MFKQRFSLLVLSLVLLASTAHAEIRYETLLTLDLEDAVIDMATDPGEELVFLLTQKAVLLYSPENKAIIERIPLSETYNRIAFLDGDRLVLSSDNPARMSILRYDRIYDIDIEGHAFKGPADAKVVLVVFSDYQCPYCARLERFIEQVMEQFPDEVKFVIKQYPLSSHPFSRKGAMAALAAGKQGKFLEFHQKLLENHDSLSDQKILDIAGELELNMDQFAKDRDLEASRQLIEADIENGKAVGVTGTPSAYINGKRIRNRELGSLPELIVQELGNGNE